ncbi:adenylate kinase [Streptomyces jumonjinensis]|uniref:adenylate kinase n=1 Tax=Streptomyces jumonjinensis TaxID=1945 RepID=UPI00379E98B6
MTLRALDPAAGPPPALDRILVAGGSGAGKTTLAGKLAALTGVPRIELDELYYDPGWRPRPRFGADAAQRTEQPRWITEWHYPEVNTLLARRARLLIRLDYPVAVTMTSLALRTLLRSLHREVLWSGNREPPLRSVLTDPENILRHGWATRHETRSELLALAGGADPDVRLDVLRFTRPAELSDWLIRLSRGHARDGRRPHHSQQPQERQKPQKPQKSQGPHTPPRSTGAPPLR